MNLLLSDPAFLSAISVEAAPPPAGLLLDTYTGAAAAYSLRQLRTGVTNVVRVRRSSDNTEQDFTAGQITDGTLTSFCGAGDGFVRTWYDQSGNSAHLNQATAANQPQIVSLGALVTEGTRPAVLFDGTTDRMQSANNVLGTVTALYVAAVGTITNASNKFIVAASNGGYGTGNIFFVIRRLGNTSFTIATPTEFGISLADSAAHSLYQMQFLPNTLSAWRNQTSGTTATTATSMNLTAEIDVRFLDNGGSAVALSPGKTQEMLFWKLDQSANRAAIEADINAHYNIF